MTKRTTVKALALLLAAGVALELIYLAIAKVVLNYLPRWASNDALDLSYAEAGSWIPGRVWVRKLVVRGHDSNIQFELQVDEAQVEVELLPLLSRHFHTTNAITSGVEFRARHNVEKAEGQEKRLQAFPAIQGYDAPPVYPLTDSDPSPPEGAWLIEMENVTAQVNELWVVEYHYTGAGTAKGGFLLNPGRAFQLQPSQFVWQGGTLLVGETPVARRVAGTLDAEMHLDDVTQISGFSFTDKVKMDLALSLTDGELGFLNVYGGSLPIRRVNGDYSAELRLVADRGKLLEGTHVDAEFRKLALSTADFGLASTGRLEVVAKHDAEEPVLYLSPLKASVRDTVVSFDGKHSKPFSAALGSNSVRWLTDKSVPALQATVDVRMQPGDALLETALGTVPAAIADALLDLPVLQSRVALYLTERRSRIELLRLDAGDLQASGAWQDKPAGANGDFSVKTSLADLSVAVDAKGVSWELD